MPIIAILLALLSLGLSYIPIWGMIAPVISIIFAVIILKKTPIGTKRMLIVAALMVSLGALIIGIFKTATHTVTDSDLASKSANTSIQVIIQTDASLLKSEIIAYTSMGKENRSLEDLKSKTPVIPYYTAAELKLFSTALIPKIATKDSNKKYYAIDFTKLNSTAITAKRRAYWVMDDLGNVYLNIRDLNTY